MTWWIAFIIAVIGWYFTSTQNAKNSARSLINQEIKEARTKLNELIVSCSSADCQLPLDTTKEDFIKLQTYIFSVQELEKLYSSYHSKEFKRVKIVGVVASFVDKLFKQDFLKSFKDFVVTWFLPQNHVGVDHYSEFDLSVHTSSIRRSLTDDMNEIPDAQRLAELNLEYKKFCMAYQFVS